MSETTYFVHGPNGIQQQQNPDGSWEHAIQDGLGSVRGIVDANADILKSVHFSPLGKPFDVTGSSQTPFGYTGEMTDPNNLIYLRARYYDPASGSFPSLDPFEGLPEQPMSLNRHSYVQDDPVNHTDPSGMAPQSVNGCATQNIAQTLQAAAQSGNPNVLRLVVEATNAGCAPALQIPSMGHYDGPHQQQDCDCFREAFYSLDRFWQCVRRCSPQPAVPGTTPDDILIQTTVPNVIAVTDGCATIRASGSVEPPCTGSTETRAYRVEARNCNANCTRCDEWKPVREARFPCDATCNSTRYSCNGK